MKYRKKPIVIEAVQFTGDNFQEVIQFTGTSRLFRPVPEERLRETKQHFPYEAGVLAEVYDYLHETWVGVKANQWIIKGISDEFYPCEPNVFEATYEPA
jgi:hypothetical protein